MSTPNQLDHIFKNSKKPIEYVESYLQYLQEVMNKTDKKQIAQFIEFMLVAREEGKQIFFIGNGGSAATSSHFANDLVAGMRIQQKPFKAVSLCDNNALMTALGNDEGYDQIFSKQLSVLMNEGDFVVAISASGNSPNLVEAVRFAKTKNGKVFGLLGFDGGKLKDMCDGVVHVVSNKGEYGPVEDMHMILDHLVTTYLYRYVRM